MPKLNLPRYAVSLSINGKIDPAFLERCLDIAKETVKPGNQSPVFTASALVSPAAPKFDKPDVDSARSRLTDHYPDAFTDTHGTVSGAPFVYKTGQPWPERIGGPEAQPLIRETRPVHDHPITSSWSKILRDTDAYLKARGVKCTAITGFGFANAGEKTPFCPLLVTIGVLPMTVAFEEAKTAAEHIKGVILSRAGFPDIDVAVREWTTSLSGCSPKLPSLDPLIDPVAEFRHPFASTLGLYVAPLKAPYYEGTIGLYLRRSNDSDDVLAFTTAHVARPPPVYPNTGLSHTNSNRHREEIIALGSKAYEDATTNIMSRIGTLHEINASSEKKISRLQRQQAEGRGDAEEVAAALLQVQQDVVKTARNMEQLNRLHSEVTKLITNPKQRPIGSVLHADPIDVSSDGPDGFTIDWAVIQLNKDAFDWDEFKGNKVYIGTGQDQGGRIRNLMFPNRLDRVGYEYPQDGLLQICGLVPESEIRQPQQLSAHGDTAMPVIKNGLVAGTTVGWVNGLQSLVRHYDYGFEFTALETTILPYGGRGAFSDQGDSGATILDRRGRIVAVLTGGGGTTDETDVTFGTAWYELEPHIKKALPGCYLYPVVPDDD
ncbi:hypothetical protein HOY82DRAFT_541833 [Tuber indicum]|nr:hypothetical protein HOY82DRAFT_541833 [Tuber indicum]